MTLVEFLLARIAEDEHFGTHDRHLSKRWAAECDAKRRIVDRYQVAALRLERGQGDRAVEGIRANESRSALKLLALPYSDHPDYDEAWRP